MNNGQLVIPIAHPETLGSAELKTHKKNKTEGKNVWYRGFKIWDIYVTVLGCQIMV